MWRWPTFEELLRCGRVPVTVMWSARNCCKNDPLKCRVTWTLKLFFLLKFGETKRGDHLGVVLLGWEPGSQTRGQLRRAVDVWAHLESCTAQYLTFCLMEEEKQPVQNNKWLLIPWGLEYSHLQPKPSLHLSPTFSPSALLLAIWKCVHVSIWDRANLKT